MKSPSLNQDPRLRRFWVALSVFGLAFFQLSSLAYSQIPFQLEQKKGKAQPPKNLSAEVEENLFHLTNLQRAKKKLEPLAEERDLANIAAAHSKDMLRRNYMSHVSPEGKSVVHRYSVYDPKIRRSLGENLHAIESSSGLRDPRAIAEVMVRDWMNSSSHRKNILSKKFSFEGLGCASDGTRIFCTQVFAGPKYR